MAKLNDYNNYDNISQDVLQPVNFVTVTEVNNIVKNSSVIPGKGINIDDKTKEISVNIPISSGTGKNSIVEGDNTIASGYASHAEGQLTIANGFASHAEGFCTITRSQYEHAIGQYNISSSASTTFGNSGNTLFSVGNGTAYNKMANAFEIRQNGDIYLSAYTNSAKTAFEYSKLQDKLVNIEIKAKQLTDYVTYTGTTYTITTADTISSAIAKLEALIKSK